MNPNLLCFSLLLLFACKTEPPVPFHESITFHHDGNFFLPEEWESVLWGESPMFYNPTNIDVDIKGRIWVTEAVNYRDFNNKPEDHLHFEKGDRVVILEDTNGDGLADDSKVFVQDKDLRSPVGIAVLGNRVVVSCSPHLIVYTDEDGDDKPDHKEILLTGFGGYDHDHSLHAVVAGADGKWYFNTGNAGPHVVTDRSGWTLRSGSLYTGGSPYNLKNQGNRVSDDGRVWVGGLALRMNPDGTDLEVVGHNFRNAYELTVDSYGNMWQNDNDDQVVTCRATWLMEGGNAGFFSSDGTRTWQADQRPWQDDWTAHWHQEDPGTIPPGDRTGAGSPTAVAVYESDALGAKYRGMFLTVDAGRNVVFAYMPKPSGAGFELNRVDLIKTVGESTEDYRWNELDDDENKSFRPSDVAVGTDGSLYIADWYDPIVGGHQMHDREGYGRIYRIFPKGKELHPPSLDPGTVEGQIAILKNPAVNVRNAGFEALRNQGAAGVDELEKLLESDNPFFQARAVGLLAHLGEEGLSRVEQLLSKSRNPEIRVAAYRALRQDKKGLLKYAAMAASDPDAQVRREVAISLRDVPLTDCEDLLVQLYAGFDGSDPWYLEALGMAMEGKESEVYALLLKNEESDPAKWSMGFARLVWRLHPPEAVEALKMRAMQESASTRSRSEAATALAFIPGPEAAQAMIDLSYTAPQDIRSQASWWLNFRKTNLWRDAIEWETPGAVMVSALPDSLLALQSQILDAGVHKQERRMSGMQLARNPAGGMMLLSLAAQKKLPAFLLSDPDLAAALFAHSDPQTRILAGLYFDPPVSGKLLSVSAVAAIEGNADAGRQHYKSTCVACHKTGDQGSEIGPSLRGIGSKLGRKALIDAIIHPGASITFGYEPTILTTQNGETIFGRMLAEGEVIVIKDMAGQNHRILASEVESQRTSGQSLMPEPEALGLDAQAVANIVKYLSN